MNQTIRNRVAKLREAMERARISTILNMWILILR